MDELKLIVNIRLFPQILLSIPNKVLVPIHLLMNDVLFMRDMYNIHTYLCP